MKKTLLLFVILHFSQISTSYSQDGNRRITAGNFSTQKISSITPEKWQAMKFDNIDTETAYFLTRDNNQTVFKAVSNAAASGYIHKISIDPKQYPILTWSWKIDNLIKKSNINTKEGDDYPARIYVTFEYDTERLSGWESFKVGFYKAIYGEYPPLAVLNYVWANKKSVGYTTPNAYTKRVQMLVAQSGQTHVGKWVKQQANIYDDYKRVFGEVPMKITAIAIMTDTDNTLESATAYYGDIYFSQTKD
ncbi:hypothetical protein MNBD_GAMMA23-2575 [hydrothermal vent metagenome]|uniref:DUF3047 domain-containing protein n=1 Tax=hydrothermal vent metagenome TaxID=652676 RepID=A0A3B0ZCB3_9ZZZZ